MWPSEAIIGSSSVQWQQLGVTGSKGDLAQVQQSLCVGTQSSQGCTTFKMMGIAQALRTASRLYVKQVRTLLLLFAPTSHSTV